MARIYTVPIDNGSITNANGDYELVELDPASDKPIEICGWDLGQLTELQEAQEEQLRIAIYRGYTTDGTGGSSVTPVPNNPSDNTAGFTADILRTAIASGGTGTLMWAFSMPVRSGHQWGPVPEGYGFFHAGANLLVMRLVAAVADDLTFQGSIMVREY
jgi:hypothetical protein